MASARTMTDFFRTTLGAPLKNSRWSWGAISPSTRDVFLRVWEDQRDTIDGRDCVLLMGPSWKGTGIIERREHIQAFREGAPTYAILCTAQDTHDPTRKIAGFDSTTVAMLGKIVEKSGLMFAEIAEYVPVDELVQPPTGMAGAKWTRAELDACVDAYFEMLSSERRGEAYSKSAYNERLRHGPLPARTRASIEYRMQNISTVLNDLGLGRIKGYIPAKNVGSGTRSEILDILQLNGHIDATDYEDTADDELLQRRATSLKAKGFESPPRGNRQPRTTASNGMTFLRSPAVRAWVMQAAKGVCELCRDDAPFSDSNDEPFLEVHHVFPLATGGSDTTDNAVGLCPNCHRRCHYAKDSLHALELLYGQVPRLKR